MFGLGMPEILMILAIALIVIGPKKLPDLAKTLGRAMGEFKRSAQDFKNSIDVETTVKDMKDIEMPETDLEEIIKDANFKDDPVPDSKDGEVSDKDVSDTETPEYPADEIKQNEAQVEDPEKTEPTDHNPDKTE